MVPLGSAHNGANSGRGEIFGMYSSFSFLIRYQFLKTVKEFFQQDSNSIDSVSIDLPQQPSSPINIPNHRTRNPIESHLVKSHSSIVSLVERERARVSPQNGVVWGRRGYERVHQRRTSRKLQERGLRFHHYLPLLHPPPTIIYIYIYIHVSLSLFLFSDLHSLPPAGSHSAVGPLIPR